MSDLPDYNIGKHLLLLCTWHFSLTLMCRSFKFDEVSFLFWLVLLVSHQRLFLTQDWLLCFLVRALELSYVPFWVHVCVCCKGAPSFILIHVDIPLYQHCLLKIVFFPHWLVKNELAMRVYLWALSLIPLIYISILIPVPHFFLWLLLYNKLGNRSVSLSTLLFFSKIVSGVLGLLNFQVNFRIILSIYAKEPAKILIRIALYLQTSLRLLPS